MTASTLQKEVETRIDAAEALDPQLNAFLSIEREHAVSRALAFDGGAKDMPLGGMCVAVKDNICTKGMRTSCGSHILHNYVAQYDATAISRLTSRRQREVGAWRR